MSVMEMSHRGATFVDIAARAEADLRELLAIGDDYAVLFLQGGATSQFAAVPLNLMRDAVRADYVHTGSWSKQAIEEARRFCDVGIVASSESTGFDRVPDRAQWKLTPGAAYVHICSNETIGGVQYHDFPTTDTRRVADMSSDILTRPLDVSLFGLIYAGAHKNIGPAGLVVVIVRRDLLGSARPCTPKMLDYAVHAAADSMSNTPPTYAWYLAGLVFAWLKREGGLPAIAERNARKAKTLYNAIDGTNYYTCPVQPASRSLMNVPFTLPDAALDKPFLAGAAARGLEGLKGHRSVGGMRASLYNAVGQDAVDALVRYMAEFEREHG
jgi:phosphoserine aminotransferase